VANIKSAKKKARQAEKARIHNMALRSKLRTQIKNVKTAIAAGDAENAGKLFKEAVPVIDSMVNKRIIHKNTAARYKSHLNAGIKKLVTT
jgi:small subunit ribosomal protein S20